MRPGMGRWLGLVLALLFCGALLSYGVTQEVPIGKFTGKVVMKENGKALANALVIVTLTGTPDEDRPRLKGAETDKDGNFSFLNLPAGDYELEVSANQHNLYNQRVTVEEGKAVVKNLEANPVDPYLNLYASQKVFTPDETPRVELHGFVPDGKVDVWVYRLKVEELAKVGGLDSAIWPLAREDSNWRQKLERTGARVADLSHAVQDRDAEGAFVETLPVGKLEEGLYFVTCSAGDNRASTLLNVSKLALVTKSGADGIVCYTTDIKTGKPVGGVELFGRNDKGLDPIGKTDGSGLAKVKLPAQDVKSAIVAKRGTSAALVGLYDSGSERAPIWISGYCERPAYRPGDEIQFKGFVRRVDGDGYRLPGTGSVQIEIKDPDGNPIERMTLPVSVHGSFHGSFSTSSEGKPGGYAIYAKAFGRESYATAANVVAYRKPEFSIEVKPRKDHYVMGERASAVVECKYYYGGPVVGAKVHASVYRSPAYFYTNEDGEEESVGSYGGGEYSQEVEVVTDAAGQAVVEFDTRAEDDPDFFTNDYNYTVYASVTEDQGKYFNGTGEVRVVRGDFSLDMDVQNPIVTNGQSVELEIRTINPIDGTKMVPNRDVVIEAGREEWTDKASVFVPRQRFTVKTGADGKAHLSVPVTSEQSIAFRGSATDDRGHRIVATAWAYVEGSPARIDAERGDLKVTLDQKRYTSGQEAKVLLQTNMPGGSALVCLQTDRVLWQKIVPLTSQSTIVEIPVRKEYAPNVYVSAAYVSDKHFMQADHRLRVDREDRVLKVAVSSDREVYKPGDTARVTVKTTDSEGRPAPAEVSVGVVDEGIYDIAEDSTDLYASLYPARSNWVNTSYSFPEIYLDGGDKGSSNIPLRKNFKDTAQWLPEVQTDANGEATVSITLPDNLTEWRVTAIGLTDKSMAGKGTASFRVKKDLMVRLQLPQYLIGGDHQRMTAVIANDTGRDQDVNIELAATGVRLNGEARQTIRVPAGKPQVVELDTVAETIGQATVTAKVWIDGGGPTDGVQQSFPIQPHGRKVVETKAGEGALDFTFAGGPEFDAKYGSLRVELSPTLAGDLVKALDGLIDFPYGCVEQTMSRFMPSVLVDQTVRELGLPKPKRFEKLPQIVRDSLTRLDKMRHYDGGWGWWEWDASDPFMTALVLDGLDRARTAGYDVSIARPQQAADWAMQYLQAKDRPRKLELRDRLYLIYALLRWGKTDAAKLLSVDDLKEHVEKIGKTLEIQHPTNAELATAALAFKEARMETEANAMLDRLAKKANVGEELVSWTPEEGAWGEEVTALALTSFEALRPKDPLVPKIVRYLMVQRQGDAWFSTRDTAYSLVGLTAYLAHSKELESGSTATVLVNGKEWRKVSMNPRTLDDPNRTVEIPIGQLGVGPVKVEVRKEGEGRCYYAISLNRLDTSPALTETSTDKGLKIVRNYYRMEARQLENGTMRFLPSEKPITKFQNGDLVRVELTITSDVPRSYVMVEEPTPSSCRVTERTELEQYESKSWWWSRTVLMDDHAAFFARTLGKGVSKIAYTMRAEQAGEARALPSTVRNMYDPGRWASSAEATLEVTK